MKVLRTIGRSASEEIFTFDEKVVKRLLNSGFLMEIDVKFIITRITDFSDFCKKI
jgi:hypothetical protein